MKRAAKTFCSTIILLLLAAGTAPVSAQTARKLPPAFKSDGCTFFPDGNYRRCCEEHDRDYYQGGTRRERSASDARLFRCVSQTRGRWNRIAAPMMWFGVRIGGVSFLPTKFRWGFGKRRVTEISPD